VTMTKPNTPEQLTIIHSQSEAEEGAYWQHHTFSEEVWEQLPAVPGDELPPPRARTRSIAVRFDDSTLKRVKALAARRHTGYQTLLAVASRNPGQEEQDEGEHSRRPTTRGRCSS